MLVGNRGCDSLLSWEFAEAYFHAEELADQAERVRRGIQFQLGTRRKPITKQLDNGGKYANTMGIPCASACHDLRLQ